MPGAAVFVFVYVFVCVSVFFLVWRGKERVGLGRCDFVAGLTADAREDFVQLEEVVIVLGEFAMFAADDVLKKSKKNSHQHLNTHKKGALKDSRRQSR